MKTKQLIMVVSVAVFSSSVTAQESMTASEWLMKIKSAANHSLSLQYPRECNDKELAGLPNWKIIQCRSAGTGLRFCQDKTFTISIDSQPAYPSGGVPKPFCHVDVKLTAEVKEGPLPKLAPGCYFIRHCIVCKPPNIAEGCGAGYTQEDLKAWEQEEAKIFGWEHVRKLEGK